jgi:hypothetical protein
MTSYDRVNHDARLTGVSRWTEFVLAMQTPHATG